MRIVFHASLSVMGKSQQLAVLGRGRVELENEVGITSVPIRLLSKAKDGKLSMPFIGVDHEAKYNGGRSMFSPWVDDTAVDGIKAVISVKQLFNLSQEAGESVELTMEIKDGQLVEVSRRTRNNVTEEDSNMLAALSEKFSAKAAELQAAKNKETPAPEAKDQLKAMFAN